MIVIDDFLYSYQALKDYALNASFGDAVNPVDSVVYPYICDEIPSAIKYELIAKISCLIGRPPQSVTLFMRRSPKGVSVPHMAHTDNSMGKWSLMLYMNDYENGGTAMLSHWETGMSRAPSNEYELEVARMDQNNIDSWDIIDVCQMKENRACIFEAERFHCALPVGGFGSGSEARTVMTCFFS